MNLVRELCQTISIGCIISLLVGCGKTELSNLHRNIPMQNERGAPLRHNEGNLSINTRDKAIANLEDLSDLFEVEACIKLEAYDIAPMSIITHLVRVGDRLFLNDLPLHQVFQFDMQGSFLGTVGRVGEGPGEYEFPSALVANDNYLIIFDGGRAQYLVYDKNGNYLKKYDGNKYYINSSSLLPWHDSLLVIGFPGYSPTAPYHAILKMENEEFKLVTGFGKRPAPAILPLKRTPKTLNAKAVESYARVGDRIWVGSPFQTTIEVYDLSGRFVASLPTGVDGIRPSDLGDAPSSEQFRQIEQNKFSNCGINVVESWVIAYFRKGQREIMATVYDYEGNILTSKIPALSMFTNTIAKAVDGRLVCPILLESWNLDTLKSNVGELGTRKIMDSGFEPGAKEEAMYLVFSMPKEF